MSEFPKYIWFAPDDTSRNPYAAFRRTFTIQPPGDIKAEFHIFADTQYDLFVNGRFVGYGPARFDPRRPQYDSYDLSGFLTEGKNVIAVLANFVGHKTFKSIPGTAAMIAWGEAKCGGRKTDLSTGSGWKCLRHAAYNRYAPKLSFALGAQAFYDQAAFDSGWTGADYDDSAWPEAVEVSAGGQSRLGRLTAREIPFMSLEPVAAAADTRVFPLADNEERYSFSLELPFTYATANDPQDAYCRTVAWSTYVYSPREQAVSSSILYDKIWVNGVAAETFEDPSRQLRRNFIMRLNQGWNYVFGTADMGEDVYNLYLTLPKGCGLTLSAGKNPESGLLFRHTRVMPKEYAAEISSIPAPWPEDADISPVGGWTYTASADAASSPNRESGLDTYGPPAETVSPDKLNGFVIEKSIYPDGAALVIDVGHMRLLFPCLRLRGVKGAAIDLVYGDRYAADGMHLRERSWIPLADRLVCSEDVIAWMPI
ncbi:MAG: hypothetical protein FWF44_12315, partial [Defluviitaleaceae bacterium]|nr:hypothetical protein [Defluviitaleaceae bacterium]